MNKLQLAELQELCRAAVDGELDAGGERRLNDLIRSDVQACRFYVDYLEVHALLAWRHGAVEPLELPLAANRPPQPSAPSTLRSYKLVLAIAAALVLAVGGLGFLLAFSGGGFWNGNQQQPIAVVIGEEDVEWSGNLSHNGDQQLAPGRQRIDSGTARIELTNGVLLAAAGPCDFEITSPDRPASVFWQAQHLLPTGDPGFHGHHAARRADCRSGHAFRRLGGPAAGGPHPSL